MLKKKLTAPDYILIAANLLPAIGVWVWGWNSKEMFLVYCLETIIIGIFNLFKMGIATVFQKRGTWYSEGRSSQQSGLVFMLFFLMHYGLFVGVQMGIFFGVSGVGKGTNINALTFFYKWPQLISTDSLILLGVFVFGNAYRMFVDFILPGEYRRVPMIGLMFQPYGRIFIQQFTVILGSMFLSFGAGKIFILIFAVVKIYFELLVDYQGILSKGLKNLEKKSG